MGAPERIYLTEQGADHGSYLWCEDKISNEDAKYIRADLVERLKGYEIKHKDNCQVWESDEDYTLPCTCGLTEVLKEMEG